MDTKSIIETVVSHYEQAKPEQIVSTSTDLNNRSLIFTPGIYKFTYNSIVDGLIQLTFEALDKSYDSKIIEIGSNTSYIYLDNTYDVSSSTITYGKLRIYRLRIPTDDIDLANYPTRPLRLKLPVISRIDELRPVHYRLSNRQIRDKINAVLVTDIRGWCQTYISDDNTFNIIVYTSDKHNGYFNVNIKTKTQSCVLL